MSPAPHRLRLGLLLAFAAAVLALAAGFVLAPEATLAAWLAAFIGLATVPVGCLLLLLSMDVLGGAWRIELRPVVRAGAACTPLLCLLVLPLLLGAVKLYPWAGGADLTGFKAAYLSLPFFIARSLIYVIVWSLLALLMVRTERPQPALASVGLILMTLTGSLAAIDWGMSVEPAFRSSIYGLMMLGHQALAGAAAAILVRLVSGPCARQGMLAGVLAAGIVAYLYLAAMQYLIIWGGNVPAEVTWYATRNAGGWFLVPYATLALQLAASLFILATDLNRRPRMIMAVCVLTLVMRAVDGAWFVLPALQDAQAAPLLTLLLLVAALVAIGLMIGIGLWRFAEPGALRSARFKERAHG